MLYSEGMAKSKGNTAEKDNPNPKDPNQQAKCRMSINTNKTHVKLIKIKE